jgi:membrane-bound serine protease (ClpP class)
VKKFFIVGTLLGLILSPPGRAASVEENIVEGSVVVVPLQGEVTEAQFLFLRRVLKKADRVGAAALILNMDTPGGDLKATDHIVQALSKVTYPTFTYVNTNAGSAGALISLGTGQVYMAPVSAIGAAAPVLSGGAEVPETMNAKVVSYYSGYFRSVAQRNGYNPNLVDAFMNLKKEVKIGDRVLNPEGALLTLSAQEAVEVIDGKPLLARGIVASLPELCEKAGLAVDKIVEVEPSGFERLAQLITTLAPLLLIGGIVGAYMEFKSPGFGVPGILSALCFLLYFTGHYVAGLTGYEVGVVFLLGVVLVLVEILFFPGIFVLAAIGSALMMGALFLAMVDYYPSQPLAIAPEVFVQPLVNFGIALVLSVVAMVLLARYFPSLPFFKRLILATQSPSGPSFEIPSASATEAMAGARERVKVGDEGVAHTTLRPSGKAAFGERLVDVIADGEFIVSGTAIRVMGVEGERVTVEAVGSA